MTPLDKALNEIIDPRNFIKNFADVEHFKEWARTGTINDLKACIVTFEHHEMYSVCEDLQQVIDEKVSSMLSGMGFED